jgi:small subunit ribosomal protein S16
MLTIRMQRTGRTGHAQFRVIVQDSRFSPTGGRVTAYLGSYDPHTKVAVIDKDKTIEYLTNGAQPSNRVAKLLQKEGVKLPGWVKAEGEKKRSIRHPDKLRRNRPPEAKEAAPVEATEPAETTAEETPVAEANETPAEEATPTSEAPAETPETTVAEEPGQPADETAIPEAAEPTTEVEKAA